MQIWPLEQIDQVGAEGSRISLCNISETIYWILTQSSKAGWKGRAWQCFPPEWSCWVFYSFCAFGNIEDASNTVLVFSFLCIALRQTHWVFLISKDLKGRKPELLGRGCPAPLPWSAQDVRHPESENSLHWSFPALKMPNLEYVRTEPMIWFAFWFWVWLGFGGFFATALAKYSLAAGKTSGTFYVQCFAVNTMEKWFTGPCLTSNFKSLQSWALYPMRWLGLLFQEIPNPKLMTKPGVNNI